MKLVKKCVRVGSYSQVSYKPLSCMASELSLSGFQKILKHFHGLFDCQAGRYRAFDFCEAFFSNVLPRALCATWREEA